MANTDLAIAVPATANEVAAIQREAEEDLGFVVERLHVTDEETYTLADTLLTGMVQRKDALLAMRKRATGPLKTAAKEIESWFKPAVAALETCERHLKGELGAFRLAQATEAREAREAATVAAEAGDSAGLLEALNSADETPPEGRATCRMVWQVARINEGLVTREWLIVDRKRIDATARKHRGDTPPVIPGVTFEQVAQIGARR